MQAVEAAVAEMSATLRTLSGRMGTLSSDVQAQIANVRAQLSGLQQLLDQFNQGLGSADTNISALQGRVTDIETQIAGLSGGLASYDQLDGSPCTTIGGTPATVHLIGLQRTPVCANMSADGRFIDYGLVVIDTRTNLMWERKDHAGGLHDVDNNYTYCQVMGYNYPCSGNTMSWINDVNAERFAGFSDWRVPTQSELQGIVDGSVGPPFIDTVFGPTQATHYWSSTEIDDENTDVVFFGPAEELPYLNENEGAYVRAVRTAQ